MSLDLNKDVIEEIRHRSDIVEVITSCGVQLKRAGGSSYKGLCPFHQEKTPSAAARAEMFSVFSWIRKTLTF